MNKNNNLIMQTVHIFLDEEHFNFDKTINKEIAVYKVQKNRKSVKHVCNHLKKFIGGLYIFELKLRKINMTISARFQQKEIDCKHYNPPVNSEVIKFEISNR